MNKLQPIQTGTLKSQAVVAIRDAIFSGKYDLGEPLREIQLARALKVSQPTVREALFELERSGLVVRETNVGTYVTNMTTKEVRDRLEVRTLLEQQAMESACVEMKVEDFSELRKRLNLLSLAIEKDAYLESASTDLEFHRFIWQCSGNPILARTLDQVATPLFAFLSIVRSRAAGSLPRVVLPHAHAPIVAALEERNVALGRELIRKHIYDSYASFFDAQVEDCRTFAMENGD